MIPNFFIIGAARSGTTAIYHALSEHPEIFMPVKKEPNFFSAKWDKGVKWYQSLFADYAGERAVGEGSVTYTFPQYPETSKRIKTLSPEARLIYIIRNPVQRTYSHYQYYRYYGLKKWSSFDEAIQTAPDCIGASQYYQRIMEYLNYFDKDQLLTIIFEDYISNPTDTIKQIYNYLQVDDTFTPASTGIKTNTGFKPKSKPLYKIYRQFSTSSLRLWLEKQVPQHIRPKIRNKIHSMIGSQQTLPSLSKAKSDNLQKHFQPDIDKLEILLERNLASVWFEK